MPPRLLLVARVREDFKTTLWRNSGSGGISTLSAAGFRLNPPTLQLELSPNVGDGRGSGGSGLSLRSDDLDSVSELYSQDEFRQLVVAVETAPAFLGGLREFEDHRE